MTFWQYKLVSSHSTTALTVTCHWKTFLAAELCCTVWTFASLGDDTCGLTITYTGKSKLYSTVLLPEKFFSQSIEHLCMEMIERND